MSDDSIVKIHDTGVLLQQLTGQFEDIRTRFDTAIDLLKQILELKLKKIACLITLLAGCSAISSDGENYQHVLRLLCNAPPNIMETILTTKELQTAWVLICLHVDSVPKYPVPQSQLNIAENRDVQ